MVQRLIFKSTKFLEILFMLIRFNKICMGSLFFFLVTLYNRSRLQASHSQELSLISIGSSSLSESEMILRRGLLRRTEDLLELV